MNDKQKEYDPYIETIHGCSCTEWSIKGKKYNGCIQGNDIQTNSNCPPITLDGKVNKDCVKYWTYEPWCRVAKNCGYRSGRGEDDNGNTAWDFCKWKGLVKYNKNREAVLPFIEKKKNLLGLFIYLIIFAVLLPLFFKYMQWNQLTEVWIPNLDLIGTVLSFKNGFFGSRIFSFLYDTTISTDSEHWSKLIINYISILGIVYVAGTHIEKTGKLADGLAFALVMIICTYLVPNDFINETMNHVFNKTLDGSKINYNTKTRISMLSGFLVAIAFILLERFILNLPTKPHLKLAKFITSIDIFNE